MLLARTHGIDMDSKYIYRFSVLTTSMVFTETHGIESVLLSHTRTRGPSVALMRDFSYMKKVSVSDLNPCVVPVWHDVLDKCVSAWLNFKVTSSKVVPPRCSLTSQPLLQLGIFFILQPTFILSW